MTNYLKNRNFLKCNYKSLKNDFMPPIKQGKQQPVMVKEIEKEQQTIKLKKINPNTEILSKNHIELCFNDRKSRRKFTDEKLSLDELSYLLWATQGVKDKVEKNGKIAVTFRNVPSGGARHSFETYLLINNVSGLVSGVYRYLPVKHELLLIEEGDEDFKDKVFNALANQSWAYDSAVVFVWATVVYRAEWKYDVLSHKMILLDAGHVCQNLYLACESMALGTCAIAIYNQDTLDNLIKVDGENEFSIYMASVGKVAK